MLHDGLIRVELLSEINGWNRCLEKRFQQVLLLVCNMEVAL